MPAQGYPDFTRLSTSGGFQLGAAAGVYNSGDVIFSGFVGTWPYLNIFATGFSTAAFVRYVITYYADAGLTQQAGQQQFTRSSINSANTQYAVLAPWCQIKVLTVGGGQVNLAAFNVYGSYGGAGGARLEAPYSPVATVNTSVAALSTVTQTTNRVIPGPAVVTMRPAVSKWAVSVQYYDFDAAAYRLWWQANDTVAAFGGTWGIPLPDAPVEMLVTNNTSSAGIISAAILAASY